MPERVAHACDALISQIERPRDYVVKFAFDSSPPLPAPVIEACFFSAPPCAW